MNALRSPAAFRSTIRWPVSGYAAEFDKVAAQFQREAFAVLDPMFEAVRDGRTPERQLVWLERTKGASKDTDLASLILWLILACERKLLIQVAAGDEGQSNETRKAAASIVAANPWIKGEIATTKSHLAARRTPSTVEFLARDADGSHGARPDVLVCNELSHVPDRKFIETLMDNASKVPRGIVVIATNAGEIGSWQFEWRERAQTSPNWTFLAWSEPAPWISAAFLEERRAMTTPRRYERLWLGKWTPAEGSAIDSDLVDVAFGSGWKASDRPDADHVFVGGLDLGIAHDKAAFAIVGRHRRNGRYRLFHLTTWKPTKARKVRLQDVRAHIERMHGVFRFGKVYADPWQGHMLVDMLADAGVPAETVAFTVPNMDAMARHVLNLFGECIVELPQVGTLEAEIRATSIVEKTNGTLRLVWPRDGSGHGDEATSVMLGLWAARGAVAPIEVAPVRVAARQPIPETSRVVQYYGRRRGVVVA